MRPTAGQVCQNAQTPPAVLQTLAPRPNHQRARGAASITVAHDGTRTRLRDLRQSGCSKLRLPRRAGDAVEAVLINSSGGLTGGDEIAVDIEVGANAALDVTTQACERAYRSNGGFARVDTRVTVAEGASLGWLPQETILFDGASLRRTLTVDLIGDAEALIVEPLIFGRTAMGERLDAVHLHDDWRIRHDGRLLHAEALRLDGTAALDAPHGLNGARACATLLLVSPRAEGLVAPMRALIGSAGAVAFWPDTTHAPKGGLAGKLLARIVADDGYGLRRTLMPLLALASPRPVPKIWMT